MEDEAVSYVFHASTEVTCHMCGKKMEGYWAMKYQNEEEPMMFCNSCMSKL